MVPNKTSDFFSIFHGTEDINEYTIEKEHGAEDVFDGIEKQECQLPNPNKFLEQDHYIVRIGFNSRSICGE